MSNLKQKYIISSTEFKLKSNILDKLLELEKINNKFILDINKHNKLLNLVNKLDSKEFLNRALIKSLFYTFEANISYIIKIMSYYGENIFNKDELEFLKSSENIRIFFSYTDNDYIYQAKKILSKIIELSNKIKTNDKEFNLSKALSKFSRIIIESQEQFFKDKKHYIHCNEIIEDRVLISNILKHIVNIFEDDIKDFKKLYLKENMIEVRLEKNMFYKYFDIKMTYFKINSNNYFLCNMIGEEAFKLRDNLKYLSKPFMYSYLLWNINWEIRNGGFNQLFYNSNGKYLDESIEALETIGLYKHSEIMKTAVSRYYKDIKKIHDNLNNCNEFWETYKKVNLKDLEKEFFSLEDIFIKADRYLLKNVEHLCI